jgi:hypothetical protein
MKLNINYSECSCVKCSFMCQAPCCGTPDDIELLIEKGYANRLMFDDLPGGENMIKPALKGHEGKMSPWNTFSREGCTFWSDGKCELHTLGLKPSQGKLCHHSLSITENLEIGDFINESWENDKGIEVINKWKKITEQDKE